MPLFFTVPLPSPNRGKPPILQMALQSPFFFFKVKWRSCLSIFWKPSLICPQLLKPHFDKLLHRYVRWLKTRWASSTGMMLGEGLKSVKNTPSDLPIYTDTNLKFILDGWSNVLFTLFKLFPWQIFYIYKYYQGGTTFGDRLTHRNIYVS